ncbi:hypothetical protein BZL30_5892 [Mycobacterium kansasii]|uniref:Uncharacterized protein n=1 Tax=Mycobacterium kansasii TaxID=1768 RepID=A0A1V3WZF8_MYCKA|nr:hypothetical protein BZL30_5892 [Mycobacterium kansasii]
MITQVSAAAVTHPASAGGAPEPASATLTSSTPTDQQTDRIVISTPRRALRNNAVCLRWPAGPAAARVG